MVRNASEDETRAWGAIPSKNEMALRRISSVLLMGGLLIVITPFSPFTWLFTAEGPELLDHFFSVPLLLGALFFQWRIAGVVGPLQIQIMEFVFFYSHNMYWSLAGAETAAVLAVQLMKNEIVRRLTSVGLVGALWAVGWAATPQAYKREAWENLKWIWTWMAIGEARAMVRGGRRRW